jgi:hypothetical protein
MNDRRIAGKEKRQKLLSKALFAEEATGITSMKCLGYEVIRNERWPSEI